MASIRVLEAHIANQIAAGEVIERPASVVKELVENAIDAGATHIDVFVEEGGLVSIRVVDNGSGMDETDAVLAFQRHATSKLRSDHDLFRIRTLGFRGEALPSIASVSRVQCMTAHQSAPTQGCLIQLEAGTVVEKSTAAAGIGTDITIRDLFFNTPARLKYLRSLQTENAHISETVSRMALAHPDVGFRLTSDDKLIFATTGKGQFIQAYAAVYGVDVARKMLSVDTHNSDFKIDGYVGRPDLTRANRAHCLFFINGRIIRSTTLARAVQEAYRLRIPDNRFPVCALHIHLDPTLVDVNVHPAKAEVRFSEEKDLLMFVRESVHDVLAKELLVPDVVVGRPSRFAPSQERAQYATPRGAQERLPIQVPESMNDQHIRETVYPEATRRTGIEYTAVTTSQVLEIMEPDIPSRAHTRDASWLLRPVGQVLGMYIVAQDEDTLYIIDQHAAHERVLYESFMATMLSREVVEISLLVPMTIEVTPADAVRLASAGDAFREVGITLEPFGDRSFLARTIPSIWEGLPEESLLRETIDDWLATREATVHIEAVRDRVVMKSCKAAVKANEWLSMAEMEALCASLTALENPFACPHGRPILIRLTNDELARQFKRTSS